VTAVTAVERAELRDMARELARRELRPRTGALDAADPAALAHCWGALAEVGLDRALLPEEHGGAGLGVAELLTAVEELATADGGIAMCAVLSNAALLALGSDRAAGVREGARWVIVPARAGAEVTLSQRSLVGRVASALGAHGADGIVLAIDRGEPALVAIDARGSGIACARDDAQMGLRAAPAASIELALADVEVLAAASTDADGTARPEAGRAKVSAGAREVARATALVRAGTAAVARGITRRAYELAYDYARERRQGGVAIIEHEAVADMLAAMAVTLALRAPAPADAAEALALKIAATDAAVASTTDAVQVFGGTGYMYETGVEKLMRDAKYCQLFPEPNWIARQQLVRLAGALAEARPALEDGPRSRLAGLGV
jgi:butyryl-CoA dehydrogenase